MEIEELSRSDSRQEILESVQRRILWLATSIVHHANRIRPNPSTHRA